MKPIIVSLVIAIGVTASPAFADDLHTDAGNSKTAVASVMSDEQLAGIIAGSTANYVPSGMGFVIGAIMKFKQHKDNPTGHHVILMEQLNQYGLPRSSD